MVFELAGKEVMDNPFTETLLTTVPRFGCRRPSSGGSCVRAVDHVWLWKNLTKTHVEDICIANKL